MILNKYRLYCHTEGMLVYTDYRETAPTKCPNNPNHEINTDSIASVETIDSTATEVTVKGFKNLTGHNYWKKGFHFINDAGKITEHAEKFDSPLYLCGGGYHMDENSYKGDNIELSIVDVDGILGYGPNVNLGYFVSSDFVWANKHWEVIMEDAKLIPPGIYIKLKYDSKGQENVDSFVWYVFRTA